METLLRKLSYFKSMGEVSSARFNVNNLIDNWEKQGLTLSQIVSNLTQLDMQ